MKNALQKILVALGVASIVLASICVYAADDDILTFMPALVRAQTAANPVGTWTGTGVAGSMTSGSMNECAVSSISVTVASTAIPGFYRVSYTIPSFCLGNWMYNNVPAVMVGNRLVFGFASFADIGNPGSTTRMETHSSGELQVTNNSVAFSLQTQATAVNPELVHSFMIGGTLTKQ
ncbi:hypothetical protein [Solidesulfovibrio sp.]